MHATTAEGAPVLLAPAAGVLGGRAACGPAVATLHATRLLPLPVPDRVLARVTIHGTLEPVGNPPAALALLGGRRPRTRRRCSSTPTRSDSTANRSTPTPTGSPRPTRSPPAATRW